MPICWSSTAFRVARCSEFSSPLTVSFSTMARLSPLASSPFLSTLHLNLPVLCPTVQGPCAMLSQWVGFFHGSATTFSPLPPKVHPSEVHAHNYTYISLHLSLLFVIRSISSFGGDWHLIIISNLPLTISLLYPYSQPSQYLLSQFSYLFFKNKNELYSRFTAGTHSKSHTLALATTQNCYTSEPWYPTPSPPVLPSLFCSPCGDPWSFHATILDVSTVSQPLVFVYVAWVLCDHPNPSLTSTSGSLYSYFFSCCIWNDIIISPIFPKPEKLHMAKENHPVVPQSLVFGPLHNSTGHSFTVVRLLEPLFQTYPLLKSPVQPMFTLLISMDNLLVLH